MNPLRGSEISAYVLCIGMCFDLTQRVLSASRRDSLWRPAKLLTGLAAGAVAVGSFAYGCAPCLCLTACVWSRSAQLILTRVLPSVTQHDSSPFTPFTALPSPSVRIGLVLSIQNESKARCVLITSLFDSAACLGLPLLSDSSLAQLSH